MKKCCLCLNLSSAVTAIGACFFVSTLFVFISYLIFIEDFRTSVLNDFYDIAPCEFPLLDIVIDSLFEYSMAANLLLLLAFSTRWFLLPWLVIYTLNAIALVVVSVVFIVFPKPFFGESPHISYVLSVFPLLLALVITYSWMVVKSRFDEMSETDVKEENERICNIRLGFFVQCIGGFIAITSALFLLGYYAKLDGIIVRKLEQITHYDQFNYKATISSFIISGIVINLLLIMGGSGSKWRRSLLVPWLIFYGLVVLLCLGVHQWFTTLCWVEEKIYGLISLVVGCLILLFWTFVWIVAAEASEQPQESYANTKMSSFHRL